MIEVKVEFTKAYAGALTHDLFFNVGEPATVSIKTANALVVSGVAKVVTIGDDVAETSIVVRSVSGIDGYNAGIEIDIDDERWFALKDQSRLRGIRKGGFPRQYTRDGSVIELDRKVVFPEQARVQEK